VKYKQLRTVFLSKDILINTYFYYNISNKDFSL
jgi:hypothetical protein